MPLPQKPCLENGAVLNHGCERSFRENYHVQHRGQVRVCVPSALARVDSALRYLLCVVTRSLAIAGCAASGLSMNGGGEGCAGACAIPIHRCALPPALLIWLGWPGLSVFAVVPEPGLGLRCYEHKLCITTVVRALTLSVPSA